MIAQRVQFPQMIIHPETCERQRVILRRGPRRKPDLPQSCPIVQGRILRYISIIVPDETAAQCGEIGQEDKENDQGAGDGQSRPWIH